MDLRQFRNDQVRWGWRRAIVGRLLNRLMQLLRVRVFYVRVSPMCGQAAMNDTPPGLSIRAANADELRRAARDPAMQLKLEVAEDAIARGDAAFAAFDGERMVAYVFSPLHEAPCDERLYVSVERPYRYYYNAYSRPDYRGRRIAPALSVASDRVFLKDGYRYRASYIDLTNYKSLAVGKHLGSRIVGIAGFADWFGRRLTFRSPGARRIGFRLREVRERG